MSFKSATATFNEHRQLEATVRAQQFDRLFASARLEQGRGESAEDFWASYGKGGSGKASSLSHAPPAFKKALKPPTCLGQVDELGAAVYELETSDDPQQPDMISTAEQRATRQKRFAGAPPAVANGGLGMVSSPSRGEHIADGIDITKADVQEQFRAKLQQSLDAYRAKYEDAMLGALYEGPQRDELQNILLEFRKLREGLIASKRIDPFAIEAYETSVELAIEAGNFSQLASALPPLVYELHAARAMRKSQQKGHDVAALTAGIQSLGIVEEPSDLDQRALFASYLLLAQLAAGSPAAHSGFDTYRSRFWTAYRILTLKPVDVYDRDFPPLPSSHPHLQLALAVFRAVDNNNWVKLRNLLEEGTDEGQRTNGQLILIRGVVERVRVRTFEVAKVVYPEESAAFVVKMLNFDGWWSDGDETQEGVDELLKFLSSPPNGQPSFVGEQTDLYKPGGTRVPLKTAAKALEVYAMPSPQRYAAMWP